MARIYLKELVQEIRRELESLDQERTSSGDDAFFELQSMELELKFTVEESLTGKGGIDLRIFSAGDESKKRSESVQTIKLTYQVAPTYEGSGRRAHRSARREQHEDKGIKPLE